MRADRLVSLVLLLQTRGRTSAPALAAELEVSVRTVYRDLAALGAAGVPVITEPGRDGGCRLLDGYRFPLRGLSGDEASALLMLGVPAAAAELGLAEVLAAAHRKIRVTAGSPPAVAEPALVHLDMPRWFHGTEPVPHLRTLAGAVRGRHPLEIGYRRADADADADAGTIRVVCPLGLVNKAGTWYLVASGTRPAAAGAVGEPAVFRAGRMTSARALPGLFARPPGFDLAAFWAGWSASFMASRPKVAVRVRASDAALAAFGEVFGDAARPVAGGTAGRPGYREVTLTFEHEAAAVHRLAGFGGQLEVISPPGVRARLVATARELLGRYHAAG